jgi:hypothetical protein
MGAFISDLLRKQNLSQLLGLVSQGQGGQDQGQTQGTYDPQSSPSNPQFTMQGQVQPQSQPQSQSSDQGSQGSKQLIDRTQQPPLTPREQALQAYRSALQAPAPEYHPSILRRVVGGLLGGTVGITNPQAGNQLATNIVQSPYKSQLSKYQRDLAQKKEAYDLESSAEAGTAKNEEQMSQKKAEEARANAEEARRAGEAFKISPEGQAFEIKKLNIEHPNTPKLPTPYQLLLNNGEKVIAFEGQGGQFNDSQGNIYGPSAVKNAYKLGMEPKEVAPKEPKPSRAGEEGAIDAWTAEHGRAPNYSERIGIHRQVVDKVPDSGTAEITKEFKLQSAKEVAARSYQRNLDQSSAQLTRINNAIEEVDSSKPEYLAAAIPTVLTAIVSGQGTGVRITQPEMNSLIKARGFGDSIEAFTNKISGKGDLSAQQKKDLKGLLSDVQSKITQKQREYANTIDEIYDSDGIEGINKARTKFNKSLTQQDQSQGTNNSKDPLGILK